MVDSQENQVDSSTLLETKLYVPKWRTGLVPRERLISRLDQGFDTRLTLLSAPAGFGKTTLLAEWVAAAPANTRPAAWVSLDKSDNDPVLFWAYFIRALQTVYAGLGESSLALLRSPQPPPIESLLGNLINEIITISHDASTGAGRGFVLVLDDYHLIDTEPVHNGIAFLLDHLPPQMHVAIATRSDPPIPLARMRGRGELTELRAEDLRFTPNEAATFLTNTMGLDLTANDVAALETRTEGWIAGLQLAALSMQGRDDISGFIKAFSGDDRYIVDYLVEEVLKHQSDRVRSFLLQTSILGRLSGPLCDMVTNQEDSKALLETLERSNLFVVPLDDKRQWYRYHHLFADVLYARSIEEQPDLVPVWHRRASEWYDLNGLPSDAIRHALAAKDHKRAAGLVELAWPAMRKNKQEATVFELLKAIPDELIRVRPVLSVVYALALLDAGEYEAVENRLEDAERLLESTAGLRERPDVPESEMIVDDEEQFRSLPASIANARAYRALALGDLPGTVSYARQALDLLQHDDHYERGTTAALLGLAFWAKGDLEAAHRSFADGLASLRIAGGMVIAIGGSVILAYMRTAQGRLHEAVGTYEQSLQLANEQEGSPIPGTAELYMGLGELQRERGDLDAARQHLLRGESLGEQASLPGFEYLWSITWARIKESSGDLDGALDRIHEAERQYYRNPIPDVRPISAMKARLWLAKGMLSEALAWAHERGLSVDDDLSYLREFEHITLARVLIAQHKSGREEQSIDEAIGLLERLLKAAEDGERTGSVIEILVVQALAHKAKGDAPRALTPLERSLTLAEPESYVRTFVDEGEAMLSLLRQAAGHGIASPYIQKLLSVFDKSTESVPTASERPGAPDLAEPLTGRETEILRLISVGMTNQEIASQLVISVATVKRHITNIYGKLGVSHRTRATARAHDLNLL